MAFPIAETDDYVRKILSRAGKIKKGATPEETLAQLLPHVIHQESRGDPKAVSKKGAVGRMQTMPATLKDPGFGVRAASDDSDAERERVGRDYLLAMLKRYPGRVDLALAAYNAGPGRADQWSGFDPSVLRASAGLELGTSVAPEWGGLPAAGDETSPTHSFLRNVWDRDSTIAAIQRLWEDRGQEFDPNFNLGQLSDKEWKEVTDGIPEDQWMRLAMAGSRSHLQNLAMRLRTANKAEEELAAYGGWGVTGRIALNFLDPVALAVGIGTGGFGMVGTAATRLTRAAQVARVAGKFDEASTAVRALEAVAKGSAWKGAGTAGVVAGGTNMALEATIAVSDPLRDGWDVALAGVTGLALGAGAARLFNGRELRHIQGAYLRERSLLEVAELNHRIDLQKVELSNELAQLTARRAKVEKADPDVVEAQKALQVLSKELRATAEGRRLELAKSAEGALKRSELGALRRQTEGLRKQAGQADSLEAEVNARMLREDIEAMGETIATSKPRARLRQKSAKAEARARQETIRSNLERAETQLGRATAAEDARVELRRVERQAAKDEPLLMLDEPGRNRFGERELELTKKLQSALGGQRERLRALDEQVTRVKSRVEGLEQARKAGVQASDRVITREAEAFGSDTASAARFTGFDEGTHPHLDGVDSGLPAVGKMKLAAAVRTGPFATFSGILRGSDNAEVRKLLGPLVGNSTGNVDRTANAIGASEIHARIHESMTAKFYSAVEPAYKEWAEANGIGLFERMTRPARERFMGEVGLAIRGADVTDPAVLKAAGKVRSIFADYLKQAKEAGVKGFDKVELNDTYLPRVFDFKRLREIEQDIGSDNLRLLFRNAIMAANDDIEERIASKIAAAYVTRMKELRVGSDHDLMQGMSWDNVAFLRRFLSDTGVDSAEVEDIVGKLAGLNLQRLGKTGEGSFRNAKFRQQYDETFSMRFRSQAAAREGRVEDVDITVSDLFENNVEHLFGRYSRTVSGHIGLAKVGIKSRKDFDARIKLVERELGDEIDELRRVKDTADVAYKLITGQPIQDANTLTRLGRAARDYNFTTTMNQVGWAQFPDLAGLIGKGYLNFTLREFFGGSAFSLFRRTDGSLDDVFAREMEEWLGVGTDFHNNALFSSFDPGEELGLKGAFGKVEHGLRAMGRGTQMISGMAWITAFSQRLVARSIVQRLVKESVRGGAFSADRMAQLGLDPAMAKRIGAQLKAHTEFVNGDFGGRVRVVNWAKWDDVEARDGMLYAVFREARRLVQEEDLGDTTQWMHKNWGKIISQFRRFALVSYSKQLLHGIAHHDAEEAVRLALSMVMAGMAYTARHEVAYASKMAGGASQEELDAYREKFLAPDRLAAAAFANSSYSSLTPALFDSTVGMATGERFFDTRTSGLGSDIVTGNPSYRAFNNMTRAAQGVATSIVRGDKQFDKGDALAVRKLLPYQNVIGVDAMYQALTEDLPEQDEDPDPDKVDWFLEN